MRKAHILFVIGPMLGGGAERHLVDLVRGLSRLLFFVPHAAVLGRAGPLFPELSKYAKSAVVIPKAGKADLRAAFRLAGHIRELGPDVVHTYMWTGNLWGRLAALLAHRGPLVAAERCPDDWKRPYHFMIDRLLYRRTDRLVAVAQAVADAYERRAGVPRDRIRVIRNGKAEPPPAPHPAVCRDRLGLPQHAGVVSLVGRFSPEKGHLRLVESARAVLAGRPDTLFVLAGEGPLLPAVRAEVYRLGLEERFRFPGFLPDPAELYAASDLVVVPSDYEGISNVLLEAMARGIPAVATSVGGNPEVVVHGETGLLVPPDHPGKLASALVALLRNGETRRAMGDAARRRAQEHFSMERMVRDHAALYRELLAERGVAIPG